MRTGDRILLGEALQMLPHLIHHPVGFGVLEDPMQVGQPVITQAEQALGGPADHREIVFRVLPGLTYHTFRLLLFNSGLGPTAALGFPPIA